MAWLICFAYLPSAVVSRSPGQAGLLGSADWGQMEALLLQGVGSGVCKRTKVRGPALIFPWGWRITFYRSSSSHMLPNHFYNLDLCWKVVQMYRFTCFISSHAEGCGEKWGHLVTIRQLFLLSGAAECHIWILLPFFFFFFIAELVHSFRSKAFHQMPYTYLVCSALGKLSFAFWTMKVSLTFALVLLPQIYTLNLPHSILHQK